MIDETVEQMAAKWRGREGAVIGLLQEIQSEHNYVPKETLPEVARDLGLPLSQVYSVVTFYSSLSLEPRGKHIVTCCLGTACHVRGAERIAKEVSNLLGIGPGETTPDKEFTFETVRCLGACALAPVMVIDDKYYGHMSAKRARSVLRGMCGAEDSE